MAQAFSVVVFHCRHMFHKECLPSSGSVSTTETLPCITTSGPTACLHRASTHLLPYGLGFPLSCAFSYLLSDLLFVLLSYLYRTFPIYQVLITLPHTAISSEIVHSRVMMLILSRLWRRCCNHGNRVCLSQIPAVQFCNICSAKKRGPGSGMLDVKM